MSKLLTVVLIGSIAILPGCAQTMAMQQPGPLRCRANIFEPGTARPSVIACLGAPTRTIDTPDGSSLSDTYSYKNGRGRNSTWSKVGRTFVYTIGDLFTLFLTQLIFIPTEKLALESGSFRAVVDCERDHNDRWRVIEATEAETN